MAVMHMDVDDARVVRATLGDRSVRLGVVERRIRLRAANRRLA